MGGCFGEWLSSRRVVRVELRGGCKASGKMYTEVCVSHVGWMARCYIYNAPVCLLIFPTAGFALALRMCPNLLFLARTLFPPVCHPHAVASHLLVHQSIEQRVRGQQLRMHQQWLLLASLYVVDGW